MMRHSGLVCTVAVLLLAASAWAGERPHRVTKLDIGVYLASEFDAAATYHVLQGCDNRCYEANPLVRPFARNPGIFVALGASAYTVNYFARKFESSGHPRWAKALRVLAIGVHAGAGAQALALDH